MSTLDPQVQHVLNEALKLPASAREELAVRLMTSAESTEADAVTVKQAWVEEIDRRVARLERGESASIPIEKAWPKITGQAWDSKAADE